MGSSFINRFISDWPRRPQNILVLIPQTLGFTTQSQLPSLVSIHPPLSPAPAVFCASLSAIPWHL